MKVDKKEKLEMEERNLLSVAYKNVVGNKRQSWRTFQEKDSKDNNSENKFKGYMKLIEQELISICEEVLNLLASIVKSQEEVTDASEQSKEDEVFYRKMMGDYNRYLAELDPQAYGKKAKEQYEKAWEKAKEFLAETHPTRLGLALNFSVCRYEILKEPKEACQLAKDAFDRAIEKLDTLNNASYKDSTLIMQLLRDNMTLWTSEENNQEDAAEEEAA